MTVKEEELRIFVEEIKKILDEKFDEHQGSWRKESIDSLGNKLQDQVSDFLLRKHLKKDPKRIITHVANYCLFILIKLMNE